VQDHSHWSCRKCHGKGHDLVDKDPGTGKFICPKHYHNKKKVSGSELKATMQHLVVTVLYAHSQSNAVNSAASISAAVSASSTAIVPVVSARAVRSAIFRACMSHPDTFLSDPAVAETHVRTLVCALLPTFVGTVTPQDVVMCEAFTAADACALRQAQLAAAAIQAQVAYAPASQPCAAPVPAGLMACNVEHASVALSMQLGAVEQRLSDSATAVDTQRLSQPIVESTLDKTHLPISGAVFDTIQAELLQPCTTYVYASRHTAVCTDFVVPLVRPFSLDVSTAGAQHGNRVF
jgi:hypothetical protein